MNDSSPTPSAGSDAVEGSHFTVEDASTTTRVTDLFDNDTTAGSRGSGAGTSTGDRGSEPDEDPIASADAIAAAGTSTGPVTGTEERSTDHTPERVERTQEATATTSADRSDAPDSPSSPSTPGGPEAPSAPTGLAALVGDASVGHVFDQTNGIIEGLDGDSDGTADSDEFSSAERADENPAFEAFADTEAESSPDTDDTRTTGS